MMRLVAIIALSVIGIGRGAAQDPAFQRWLLGERLPSWALAQFSIMKLDSLYDWSDHINPFYLEADFTGDGSLDVAIAIVQKSSGKKGIAILHGEGTAPAVLGAGTEFGNGGDDFDWMNIWKVEQIKPGSDTNGQKPRWKGGALHVEQSESASGSIGWDGKAYRWEQAGD